MACGVMLFLTCSRTLNQILCHSVQSSSSHPGGHQLPHLQLCIVQRNILGSFFFGFHSRNWSAAFLPRLQMNQIEVSFSENQTRALCLLTIENVCSVLLESTGAWPSLITPLWNIDLFSKSTLVALSLCTALASALCARPVFPQTALTAAASLQFLSRRFILSDIIFMNPLLSNSPAGVIVLRHQGTVHSQCFRMAYIHRDIRIYLWA